MEDFGWRVLEYAAPVIASLICAVLALGVRWLQAKTTSERVNTLLAQVEDAVSTAVVSVQQTFVSSLVRDVNGQLTDQQKRKALQNALEAAKSVLGSKGLAAVKSALGVGGAELEAFLTTQIEARLGESKGVFK